MVVLMGETVFQRLFGKGWTGIVLTIVAIYLIVRTAILLSTAEGRAKLASRFRWLHGRGSARGRRRSRDRSPGTRHRGRPPMRTLRLRLTARDVCGTARRLSLHVASALYCVNYKAVGLR